MKFQSLPLLDAFLIKDEPQTDRRGFFSRLFCMQEFKAIDHQDPFLQINHSMTELKGTIRGMHFQHPPYSEIKVVKCIRGSIFDVIVDLRQNSETFLRWHSEILSEINGKMMYIPKGFAHGFQALEMHSEVIYFVTEYYKPESEGVIPFDDPIIKINWPLTITNISTKDKNSSYIQKTFSGISLKNLPSFPT